MFDVLRDGESRRVGWGADQAGRYRAREYFEELKEREQLKFDALFHRMADTGRIRSRERFAKEPDGIYCFKNHGKRIACFLHGRDVVLISGFAKKTDQSTRSRRHLETAARLRKEYLKLSVKEV